eukprot:TRINITY_DN5981_c0_g1_i1.p1 TRINITY_DN5981_c0_g1~~TRINITY_DN5981_c0_g1_i1.p1  ORF type:complete len:830 (-),score=190.91 TRINITY_DN5981_c0_g1_i1:158-2584(-)
MTEQTRQLLAHIQGQVVIKRNLEQIETVSREMAARSTRILSNTDKSKAQIALAKRGFDTEAVQRSLDSFTFKTAAEPVEFFPEADLEGYLEAQHNRFVWESIEETKKETAEQGMKQFTSRMESDWLATMELISHSLGQQSGKEKELETALRSEHAPSGSLLPNINAGGMSRKMMEFSHVITTLNEWRRARKPFALVSQFLETTLSNQERDAERQNALVDSWDLLQEIVGEGQTKKDGSFSGSPVEEGKYANTDSREQFLKGTIHFLTSQYKRVILNDLRLKSTVAQVGGNPSLEARIRGYLKTLYQGGSFPHSWEMIDGVPKYAFLYYCCRIGDFNLARNVAANFGDPVLAQHLSRDRSDTQALHTTYRNLDRDFNNEKTDHFKHLLYNLLGKFDSKKSYTNKIPRWSVQDWLWFQLSMVNLESGSSPRSGHSLEDLQERIVTLGHSQFNKTGQTPLLYFQVLLMTQQFEMAVDFLYNDVQGYQVEMIHFAIAMYYYGLLRLHNEKSLFYQEKGEKPAINFVKLLTQYLRVLSSDTVTALHYVYLLKNKDQRNALICELAIFTRDFMAIFGSPGSGFEGQLPQYLEQEDIVDIARETARILEQQGNLQETTFLCDFLQDYESVVRLVSNQMSKVLTLRPDDNERKQIMQVAVYYDNLYTSNKVLENISSVVANQFVVLCKLTIFYEFYYKSEFHQALKTVLDAQVLPFHSSELDRYVNQFRMLDDNVRRNFSSIILTTMKCIYQIYEDEKRRQMSAIDSGWFPGSAPERAMEVLREFSKTIVTYAGLNRFHMPSDTYALLMKIEVQMT